MVMVQIPEIITYKLPLDLKGIGHGKTQQRREDFENEEESTSEAPSGSL